MIRTFGKFEFDAARGTLKHRGTTVKLTGQAQELLSLLLERPGELISREEIRRKLWADTNVEFDHSLDVVVSRLRAAIPGCIQTVPKRGYRFIEPLNPTAGWVRKSIRYAAVAVLAALAAILVARSRYDKIVTSHAPTAARSTAR